MAEVIVNIKDICEKVTVKVRVKGIMGFQVRLWLTKQILKFAVRISRFEISFEGWSNNADIIG